LENTFGMIQSESMDLQNDPRFFQGNILNKRLSAFAQLSVVSSLMVGACSHVIAMKKEFNFVTVEGWLRVISFMMMSVVLILNIIATYVGMAQTYHTYRLETAGPTGFEIATSYYLNPNIVAWRHIAVKCLLNGLPLYLISTGIRVSMSFETEEIQSMSKGNSRILGGVVLGVFVISGMLMHYIHSKHQAVFRGNYEYAKVTERPYIEKVNELMVSQRNRGPRAPDV
ncbi:Gbp1, partial [Symbiodinium pilosum]